MTRITASLLFVLFLGIPLWAEDVRIVTWNVKDILDTGDVTSRRTDLKNMANALEPDVLVIQEITSQLVAERIRDRMELTGYHVACSDFVQSDNANRSAFEVAIISRWPMQQVIEYDPSTDNNDDDDPEELPLEPLLKIGIEAVRTSRGYLWARIDDIKLTVAVVHLKSSRGRSGSTDKSNAKKRELVAAAVALGVNEDIGLFPDYSFVCLGDLNVGHTDVKKNGTDLDDDCFSNCSGRDRYDETHALLRGGLVGGLTMRNVVLSRTTSTFPAFRGTPIDNIYVTGALEDEFSDAEVGTNTFGSDHLPVVTVLTIP